MQGVPAFQAFVYRFFKHVFRVVVNGSLNPGVGFIFLVAESADPVSQDIPVSVRFGLKQDGT